MRLIFSVIALTLWMGVSSAFAALDFQKGKSLDELIDMAKAQNKSMVLVDFYADW